MDYTKLVLFTDKGLGFLFGCWWGGFVIGFFWVWWFAWIVTFILRFVLLDLLSSVWLVRSYFIDNLLPRLIAMRILIFLYFRDLQWWIFFELSSDCFFPFYQFDQGDIFRELVNIIIFEMNDTPINGTLKPKLPIFLFDK